MPQNMACLLANWIAWSRLLIQIHILNDKQCRSRSVGFFRSQLIWIYTVCEGRTYPGSAGPGLIISDSFSVDNVLHDLSKGTRMNKVKGGGILYTRTFFLDTDSMKLLYTGSQKRFRKKNTSCKYHMVIVGLGGSVGCAVRLETRRSQVQPPPRSATFFRGDWSWNIFYIHSLPSADSRRAVVSYWRKNVHNSGWPLRGLSLPSKRVVR